MRMAHRSKCGGKAARSHRFLAAHLASARSALTGGVIALLFGQLAGCSVLTDVKKKQCTQRSDCQKLFGEDSPYLCEQSFCTRPTCSGDQQCADLGLAGAVCGGDQRCQLGCSEAQDCAEGLTCNVAERRCSPRECTTAEDCPGGSATKACNEGLCEDATWGCIGEPENRPPPQEATATLKIPVTNASTRMPVPSVQATVCRLAAYDPTCSKPVPGAETSYDPSTGVLTVTGLEQDARFRLKLEAPASTNLLPVDFYSQRPVRDVTEERPILMLSEQVVLSLAAQFSPPAVVDPDEAALYLTILDCQGKPAAGATIEVNEADENPGTQLAYLGESSFPSAILKATSASGQANVLNLPAQKLVELTTRLDGEQMSQYSVMPLAGRTTVVRFYPRQYPD